MFCRISPAPTVQPAEVTMLVLDGVGRRPPARGVAVAVATSREMAWRWKAKDTRDTQSSVRSSVRTR